MVISGQACLYLNVLTRCGSRIWPFSFRASSFSTYRAAGAFQSSEMNRFHQQQILEISLELKRLYQELKMSLQFRLPLISFVFAILAVTTTNVVLSASWSLSGDMQVVSNPSPLISPSGNLGATWTYECSGGPCDTSVDGSLVGVVNGEMPDQGTGWFFGAANHMAMINFSVDANLVPPGGNGDDKTVFDPIASGVAQVGGHSQVKAIWTPNFTGDVTVTYHGYNARTQDLAVSAPHELGRVTDLVLWHNGSELDRRTLTGGADTGYANRYENTIGDNEATISVAPGDTIALEQTGGEWIGLDISISVGQGTPPPPERSWNVDASGNWLVDSNWSLNEAPNTNRLTAIFGDVITQDRVVYTESPVTVQRVQFANNNRYIVAGVGPIHLDSGTGASIAGIDVLTGSHEFQAPVNLITNAEAIVSSGHTLRFNNILDLGGNTLNKLGPGEVAISNDLITGNGGLVNVQNGLVSGNGTIDGDVNNSGGSISPGNSSAVSGVPEPSSLLLVTLGGCLLWLGSYGRKRD